MTFCSTCVPVCACKVDFRRRCDLESQTVSAHLVRTRGKCTYHAPRGPLRLWFKHRAVLLKGYGGIGEGPPPGVVPLQAALRAQDGRDAFAQAMAYVSGHGLHPQSALRVSAQIHGQWIENDRAIRRVRWRAALTARNEHTRREACCQSIRMLWPR